MPHIAIKMYPGRDEEKKKNLAEKTRDLVMKELNMDAKYISVSVEEVRKNGKAKLLIKLLRKIYM